MEKFLFQLEQEVIKVCKNLVEKNYVVATDGNVSVRIDNTKILITPKTKGKENLQPQDLVVIDLTGKKIKGILEPSGEWRLHTVIYQCRPDVNAVIHSHPVYSTALSVAGVALDKVVLPEVMLTVGNIAMVEYATLYTEKLARNVQKYVNNCNAFILKNHGLVTIAESLEIAFYRTEKVEHLAKIIFVAKLLGKIDYLTDEQIAELYTVIK